MRSYKLAIGFRTTLGILIAVIFATTASAGTFKVLYEFKNSGSEGGAPEGVTFHAGNLYGAASLNGPGGDGTVYELTPEADGHWEETTLFSFDEFTGINPNGGLIFDSAGNLYGTAVTVQGGGGAAFELSPTAGGWSETALFAFPPSDADGIDPQEGLAFDASGNLFGTANLGGAYSILGGTVFELTPAVGGGWTETTIFSFNSTDGSYPMDNVVFDADGNLYATADHGGSHGAGTVIELTPQPDGSWTETTLYSFSGDADGAIPVEQGGLVFDSAGNLYGTTSFGGGRREGTVFELSPTTGGRWTEKVLHGFYNLDGAHPYANVIFDASGNLYGETISGGKDNDGVVFELSPMADGTWAETVLHSFSGSDGSGPSYGLIFDPSGNLYGTAAGGGAYGNGTVFEITP